MSTIRAVGKTTIVMAAGAGVTAMMTELTTTCPDILPKLPAIAAAGIMAAWALWMPAPKTLKPEPSPLEPVEEEPPAPLPPIEGEK